MAVKIRLKRMGKIRAPYYRIVVADSRKKRDGRVIEEIGKYHPKEEPSLIQVESERAQYWLGVGAQPSEAVAAILKVTGDWQRFTGQPGAEGTLRVAEPKRDKTELFNEALKESGGTAQADAMTKKATKKSVAAPAANATPAVETPEGATEEAELVEVAALDADRAEEKAGGAGPTGPVVAEAAPVDAAPAEAAPVEAAPADAAPADAAPAEAAPAEAEAAQAKAGPEAADAGDAASDGPDAPKA